MLTKTTLNLLLHSKTEISPFLQKKPIKENGKQRREKKRLSFLSFKISDPLLVSKFYYCC
ncbi:unnamed protein product [Coffea canephora]|uniref:Uncharacterized protein n=1 Tax=Coffea canephora TaxID=49390 RepID=A0A068TXI1_COFCA|nr:unnamed protein product [Coffea canephora]